MVKNKDHPFRKKWGQNFLADGNLLDKIARTIDPKTSDNILVGLNDISVKDRLGFNNSENEKIILKFY